MIDPALDQTSRTQYFSRSWYEMATKLEKELKRELEVGGEPFMLTITPDGLRLVPKGKRKGIELAWTAIISGDAALATALQASLERLG